MYHLRKKNQGSKLYCREIEKPGVRVGRNAQFMKESQPELVHRKKDGVSFKSGVALPQAVQ